MLFPFRLPGATSSSGLQLNESGVQAANARGLRLPVAHRVNTIRNRPIRSLAGPTLCRRKESLRRSTLARNGDGRSQSSPQFLPEVLVQSERSSWMPQREVCQKGDDIHPFAIWPGVPLRCAPWGCCFLLLECIDFMVTPGRFELPTCGLGNRCSIHLSYGAILESTTYRQFHFDELTIIHLV